MALFGRLNIGWSRDVVIVFIGRCLRIKNGCVKFVYVFVLVFGIYVCLKEEVV